MPIVQRRGGIEEVYMHVGSQNVKAAKDLGDLKSQKCAFSYRTHLNVWLKCTKLVLLFITHDYPIPILEML